MYSNSMHNNISFTDCLCITLNTYVIKCTSIPYFCFLSNKLFFTVAVKNQSKSCCSGVQHCFSVQRHSKKEVNSHVKKDEQIQK